LLTLIKKYIAVCQKYSCFSELPIPVQQLISGVVALSEIRFKCFEDRQVGTSEAPFNYRLSYLINYLKTKIKVKQGKH